MAEWDLCNGYVRGLRAKIGKTRRLSRLSRRCEATACGHEIEHIFFRAKRPGI